MALGGGDQISEDGVPFVVGKHRCIEPRLLMSLEGDVWPEVMAVGRQVESIWGKESGEAVLEQGQRAGPAAGLSSLNRIASTTASGRGGSSDRGMRKVGISTRSVKTGEVRVVASR